jgi:plastocyanin
VHKSGQSGARRVIGRRRGGLSTLAALAILLVVALAVLAEAYVTSTQSNADQIVTQSSQITGLQADLQQLSSQVAGISANGLSLPVMNQPPTIRTITETWYLSPSAHQDRFEPSFIVVNQGDTVRLTLIDNDTVAHDFVIGSPYNIIVNATVPGLINDLTGERFTTPSAHNSPGVVVQGAPGNVSAFYSFVAVHAGIFEFVCTYHAQVGMIGYLVVLPNQGYTEGTITTYTSTTAAGMAEISIPQGAGVPYDGYSQGNARAFGYDPLNATVVMGVNNTVTWTNNDGTIHTVTANDGSFDSGYLSPGDSFTHTFTKAGVYEYHCQLHPWMVGYVTVLAG